MLQQESLSEVLKVGLLWDIVLLLLFVQLLRMAFFVEVHVLDCVFHQILALFDAEAGVVYFFSLGDLLMGVAPTLSEGKQ
jgi:hypothetical protein